MTVERVAIPDVYVGDPIRWCGVWVIVEAIERQPPTMRRRGRHVRVELPNGDTRRLHYYDDETVEVET